MKEYSMVSVAPTVCRLLGIRVPSESYGVVMNEVMRDMGHEDRIALIVLDAFGVSTWKRFQDLTPNFNLIANQHLLYLRSVLPPKTPVNFATMATGATSEVHGIRDRAQPLNVETIFHVLAEASRTSAAAGRESSTVGVLLSKFADFKCIAASNTDDELLELGIDVIKDESPDLILMQLLDVDETGHKAGLEGNEIRTAISGIDTHLGELLPHLAEKKYGLLLLADHGAHQVGNKATHDGTSVDDLVVPLAWRGSEYLRRIYDMD